MKKVVILLLCTALVGGHISCKNKESNNSNTTTIPKAQSGKVTLTMDGNISVFDDPIIDYVASGTTFGITHINASGASDFSLNSITTKSIESGSSWEGVVTTTINSVSYSTPDAQFTIDSYDGKNKISGSFSGSFYDSPGVRRAFTGTFETNHLVQ